MAHSTAVLSLVASAVGLAPRRADDAARGPRRAATPWLLAAAALLGALAGGAARADITLAGVTEARGPGMLAGTQFRNGYLLAIDDVNATGGVLGQKLVLTQTDIDTNGDAAEAAVRQALQAKPFAVLGPVFSGVTLAAMKATANTGVPHFTGGEAASLSRKFHTSLLRTSLTQAGAIPRLANIIVYGLGAHKLALLWIDNEFGQNGRDAFAEAMTRRGGTLVVNEGVKPGQKDYTALVAKVVAAKPQALLLYLNEGESIDALLELRKQGYTGQIVGDGPLLSTKVVDGARGAAEGVVGHTGISVDTGTARMERFVAQYQARFNSKPDHNAVKGWFAVQVLRIGLQAAGKADPAAFLDKVKSLRLDGRAHPALMTSASYDLFGDLNRESYILQVRGGKTRVVANLGALDSPMLELPGGKLMAMNSNEFRQELHALLSGGEPAGAAEAVPAKGGRK